MFVNKFAILVILVKFSESQFYFGTTPSPSYNPYQYTAYNPYTTYNPYNQYPYNNQYNPYYNYSFPSGIVTGSQCICVTSGSCNRANGSFFVTTDGSGLIDIRLLNSGGYYSSSSTSVYTTPASTGITLSVSSQSSCQSGLDLCCVSSSYTCGVRFPPVVGAATTVTGQAPYGSFPWFALILQQSTSTYVASGVLIDQRHVLTVAHKISTYASTPYSLKVRLGEWTIGGSKPINFMEFNVIRAFTHYAFNPNSLVNSMAILRVSPDVPLGLTPTIATACLSTTLIRSARCWVAGYGQGAFGSTSTQSILQQVEVPLVDQTTCQNQLRTTRLGTGFILDPTSFLCAGGISGRDACTGDGGSGLMCHNNGQWYVVGLVAWGIGCGAQSIPGVYMNVTNYISWIQSTTVQA
ncbi:unnamed protein product [Chironomus riparius]|uniref:Peptidase S1 domain-containing protein n=1 Tax=Chironomus riparius TaxID=315576 RepID=A0A9N9S8I6_9DIPT|nr:unnamed protein product [Chironomus riparius]